MEGRKYFNIDDEIFRDRRTLFGLDGRDYYRRRRLDNAFSSDYIRYESNGDKDKTLHQSKSM